MRIYKTPCRGSLRFTLVYWSGGARKRQTFADFKLAKAEAETAANQRTTGALDVLTLTSADRAAYLRARQLLDPLGISLEVSAAQLADAVTKLGGVSLTQAVEAYLKRPAGGIPARTVQEVADELLAAKRADKLSERYLTQLKYDLAKLANRFDGRIGDIAGRELDDWLRVLKVAPRTRNNLRTSIGVLFNFSKGRRYLPKDHDELDAVAVAKDPEGEIEIFTPEEMVEMLAVARPSQIPFLTISAFAGVRHAELARLD